MSLICAQEKHEKKMSYVLEETPSHVGTTHVPEEASNFGTIALVGGLVVLVLVVMMIISRQQVEPHLLEPHYVHVPPPQTAIASTVETSSCSVSSRWSIRHCSQCDMSSRECLLAFLCDTNSCSILYKWRPLLHRRIPLLAFMSGDSSFTLACHEILIKKKEKKNITSGSHFCSSFSFPLSGEPQTYISAANFVDNSYFFLSHRVPPEDSGQPALRAPLVHMEAPVPLVPLVPLVSRGRPVAWA